MNLYGPMFSIVVLYLLVWVYMFAKRLKSMQVHRIHPQKLNTPASKSLIPEEESFPAHNFVNLFEVPVLFFIFALTCEQLKLTDNIFFFGSWIYVGLRYIHSFIQSTYNKVMHRFNVYFLSCMVLWYLWIRLIIKFYQ